MQKALRGCLNWIRAHSLSLTIILLSLLSAAFLYHLSSTPDGLSASEAAYRTNSTSIHNIYTNPINAPHKILSYGLAAAGLNNREWQRIVSVIFGIIFAVAFYILAKNWFGKAIGILSALLFGLTPLYLISARSGTAAILLFSPIAIMAAYYWLLKTKNYKSLAWLCLIILSGLFLYVPGVVWWLAASTILCRKKITEALDEIPTWLIILGAFIFLLMLIPASLSIVNNSAIIKDFAAIPRHFGSPVVILKNIGLMVEGLIFRTPYHDELLIGRLPIINIIGTALLAFGLYAMYKAAKLKFIAFLGTIALAIILAGINNNIHLLALSLPAIAIFMAAGLRYLYIEWRGVFPRNPIPKTLAVVLMVIIVSVQLVYGLCYSLVAWPHTPATKSAYVLK